MAHFPLPKQRTSNPAQGQACAFEANRLSICLCRRILHALRDPWISPQHSHGRPSIKAQTPCLKCFGLASCFFKLRRVGRTRRLPRSCPIFSSQVGKHESPFQHFIQQQTFTTTAVHTPFFLVPFEASCPAKRVCFPRFYHPTVLHFFLSPPWPHIPRGKGTPCRFEALHVLC